MTLRSVLLVMILFSIAPSSARAGANAGAALMGKADVWVKTTSCESLQPVDLCSAAVIDVPAGPDNYAAVYIGRCSGVSLAITGVDFGIEYNSTSVVIKGWTSCGSFATPTANWPESRSGVSVIWTTPESGMTVLVGWFRLSTYAGYGAMSLRLGEHPLYPARVLDPSSNLDELRAPAYLTWDGSPGGNPETGFCCEEPIEPTTWGRVKSQYGN
jgi:hypothetical protein